MEQRGGDRRLQDSGSTGSPGAGAESWGHRRGTVGEGDQGSPGPAGTPGQEAQGGLEDKAQPRVLYETSSHWRQVYNVD